MIRYPLFAAAVLAGTACSAQPPATAAGGPTDNPVSLPGKSTEVPRDDPVAPEPNVAASAGRANRPATPPTFKVAAIGKFDAPFALAFLPDGSLLVTEKAGKVKLRLPDGSVSEVAGVPAIAAGGQGGLLDVAVAPDFAASRHVYLTYSEAGQGGRALALARGTLSRPVVCVRAPCPPNVAFADMKVIWRAGMNGPGGQFGANVAFAPDGKSLFLSSGERQRFLPAQDPNQALGKILRLTLDGAPWPGNPQASAGGVRAQTWTLGHRNPYGLAFAPDGRLWEVEMGPRGGDEINLIEPGKNYGYPLVSNGDNYSGKPIPDHPTRPEFEAPKLWWNPSMSPGGMILYSGSMFPAWRGSLLIAALSGKALIRVTLNGATATPADYFDMGTRIRDVAQAPDGSVWLLEDGEEGAEGKLLRITP